jgi:hypothetical protein
MPTKDKALKMALKALNRMKGYGNTFAYRQAEQNPHEQVCEAITAIKQALAAPVQECLVHGECFGGKCIYTTPPAAQPAPVQEPVAWMQSDEVHISLWKDDYHTIPLYTTPPAAQRPWVGLTDRDAGEVIDYVHTNSRYGHHHTGFWMDFYRAIEAKLKEKNT